MINYIFDIAYNTLLSVVILVTQYYVLIIPKFDVNNTLTDVQGSNVSVII